MANWKRGSASEMMAGSQTVANLIGSTNRGNLAHSHPWLAVFQHVDHADHDGRF